MREVSFDWNGKICEIVMSEDVGYLLEVSNAFVGRYAYFVDRLDLDPNNNENDVCVGQWHAETEAEARKGAEEAFLRHMNGGPLLVQ
ncbi:hypothetical protein [Rhizobium glycinendophyticum]|uniref:Uncharacterized protein n=1 Tax=Rhizobium glycinendophyticum TaxID=2589807 RepID=A0A504ULD5_9HYPH|nr:hypothetical protein [Rhizobium glycinendophyticum]TPP11525.1 hypothetical protein FJQ55_12185 [Rhizobium glycinendophyticum]